LYLNYTSSAIYMDAYSVEEYVRIYNNPSIISLF
jgi:hypothetical protein